VKDVSETSRKKIDSHCLILKQLYDLWPDRICEHIVPIDVTLRLQEYATVVFKELQNAREERLQREVGVASERTQRVSTEAESWSHKVDAKELIGGRIVESSERSQQGDECGPCSQ
jgi:hypothetical protein